MSNPLRFIIGLAIILLVVPFMILGMLFTVGADSPTNYFFFFGVFGMQAIYFPLILLAIHLIFFGVERSLRASKIMVGLLVGSQLLGIAGMAPQLFYPEMREEAARVIFGGLFLPACSAGRWSSGCWMG